MSVEELCPGLPGRDAETSRIDSFLRSIATAATSLEIVGHPGVGKTALWQHGLRRADELDLSVLAAEPTESEQTLTFGALADLVSEVSDDLVGKLPDPQRHALEVALLRRPPGDAGVDPRAVGTALLSVLRNSTPALVAVDDAQWLDAASREAIRFALRRVRREDRVGLLVARRIGALDHGPSIYTGLDHHSLSLGPLPRAAVRRLVAERLPDVGGWVVTRAVTEAAGNPLHALELATALREGAGRPGPGDPVPLTDDLGSLVLGRVRRLSPGSQDALLTVALAAEPTFTLLEHLHQGDEVVELEECGLTRLAHGTVEVTHPLYAHAVRRAVSPAAVRRRHAQLAELVPAPEERARHQALAGEPPDEGAAAALERGARHAQARGALVSAAEMLEQAASWTPPSRSPKYGDAPSPLPSSSNGSATTAKPGAWSRRGRTWSRWP